MKRNPVGGDLAQCPATSQSNIWPQCSHLSNGEKRVQRAGKMGCHKGSQGQMWPPVSTVGPHGQLCPTPTCSQGPQAFTSALWQETSPRADSPTGTEIVPARTPTVSRIQHLQQHLESGTAGISSVFYLVVQLPGLGPPGSPGTQMGGVATAPAVGKGGRGPSALSCGSHPSPGQPPAASGPQFSLPFL